MTNAPLAPPPDRATRPPVNTIPPGACDCHFHVSRGPSPLVAERSYTPPDLSIADYIEMRDVLGLSRGVIVQASPHGTDNRTTIDAIADTDTMRAIVVVDADCPLPDLRKLAERGAVGARANLLFPSNAQMEDLQTLAHRIAEVGWHLQILANASTMDGLETLVRTCPVPVVLDHMGHVPADQGTSDPGFQTILRLLDTGKLWVKLSGAYRISNPDYRDAAPMARALVAANPSRLVWGSDWPHPAFTGPMPNDGPLLDLLFDWADAAAAKDILVHNPEALYGFPKWETDHGA